jgi:hypothetical protein
MGDLAGIGAIGKSHLPIANNKPHRIRCIVRDGKRTNLEVLHLYKVTSCKLNTFMEFPPAWFSTLNRAVGAINRNFATAGEYSHSLDMILMLMGNKDSIQVFNTAVYGLKSGFNFFAGKSGIDED